MASLGNFNPADFDSDGFSPIPDGEYPAIITGSEMKQSKSGGEYLSLTVEIVGEKFKGRKIFHILNLLNKNPQTELIAKQELASIARAVGHPGNLNDSNQLHGKPFKAAIVVEPEKNGYPATNRIKKFFTMSAKPVDNPVEKKEQKEATWY